MVTTFEDFHRNAEPKVREALSATLGSDGGREAAAEAFAYAWENWERVGDMANPVGYVYVVGRDRGRKAKTRPVTLMPVDTERTPWVEPQLPDALADLSEQQRVVVMLLYCFEWTMSEVADLLEVSKSTVQSHAERGMDSLRTRMGVTL